MARTLPKLGEMVVAQIEAAWVQEHPDWARKRLLVVRLIAQHESTVAQIMMISDQPACIAPKQIFSQVPLLNPSHFGGEGGVQPVLPAA